MFKELIDAFELIGKCCHRKIGDKRPFFPTEFYSEGTMLKLVVALLREVDSDVLPSPISDIAKAAKNGWMSEGELRPVFTGEGPTSADGVVGNIEIQKGTEWGVALAEAREPQLYVLEAKMGSCLSRNTKSKSANGEEGFHQAARNIACIAGVAYRANVAVQNFDGRFYVLAPAAKSQGMLDVIRSSVEVVERAMAGSSPRHMFRSNEYIDSELFVSLVRKVASGSMLVTWESVLTSLEGFEGVDQIKAFYESCCAVNLDRSQLRVQ